MQVVDDRFDLRDGTLDQPSPSGFGWMYPVAAW